MSDPQIPPISADVFVDESQWGFGRMRMCHMFSHSLEALHAMADRIGIRRRWFQNKPGFPHYDICLSKRKQAVENGAKEVTSRELVRIKNLRPSAQSADSHP